MLPLDWSLISSYLVALSIIFLPVEAVILLQVDTIRRRVTGFVSSPEQRARLFKEVAAELWQPFSTPELRNKVILEAAETLWAPLHEPESRSKLISELGHGLVRVLKENEGSLKGIAVRQAKSELLELAKGGGGLGATALSVLPGKIDLPVVGKVTIGEAMQIAQAIRGMLSGQGLSGSSHSEASSAGYPT